MNEADKIMAGLGVLASLVLLYDLIFMDNNHFPGDKQ